MGEQRTKASIAAAEAVLLLHLSRTDVKFPFQKSSQQYRKFNILSYPQPGQNYLEKKHYPEVLFCKKQYNGAFFHV